MSTKTETNPVDEQARVAVVDALCVLTEIGTKTLRDEASTSTLRRMSQLYTLLNGVLDPFPHRRQQAYP